MWSRSALLRARCANAPDFLLPAFSSVRSPKFFSTSRTRQSRVGSAPIPVPEDVVLTLHGPLPLKKGELRRVEPPSTLVVEGPLGKQSVPIPTYMTFSQDANTRKAALAVHDAKERTQRAMWGTTRGILNNHVRGVSEGHSAILRFVGVGYRALIESSATTKQPEYPGQEFVILKLGFAHPVELGVPRGVKATAPQPTRLLLEGTDKAVVTQFAASIRKWRKPEPYKGKGIFVNGETIKLKSKTK